MSSPSPRTSRRSDALSRTVIVEATIDLLDASGESGLTVRELTARLTTGRGAIYHHVAGKEELLAAATDHIIGPTIGVANDVKDPQVAVRTIALGIFDAITAHPWAGTQLAREPLQPAVRHIWKGVGEQLHHLGVRGAARSDAGAALVNYVLGAAAQHAASAGQLPHGVDRRAYLEALAAELTELDPHPTTRETAALLQEHDDREQFLAGVDIFLAGITAGLQTLPDTEP